jgi:hypothetical protein
MCKNIDEALNMKLLRTIEQIQGESKTAEYVVAKVMETPDINQCEYFDTLAFLADKETAYAKLEEYFFKGKRDERKKAEEAISRMGLSQAVDLLVNKQVTEIFSEYIAKPITKIEDQSLEILKTTVEQTKKTYLVNTIMSVVVFSVGISVVIFGAALALMGTSDPTQLWIGSGSIIAGILTTMITFVKGPINVVQGALADLAQVETAFLYNVRSTGLASFAFLKEYLKEDKPDIGILEKCTAKMKDSAKETMLLIELYGGGNDTIKDYIKEKKDDLIKALMKPSEEKTSTTEQNTTGTPPTETPPST